MQITINSQTIKFTLEKEKNLSDVMTGVKAWLNDNGLFITSIKANNVQTDYQEALRSAVPLKDIKSLDINAGLPGQIILEQLHSVYQYCVLLEQSLEDRNLTIVKDLLCDFNETKLIIATFIKKVEKIDVPEDFFRLDLLLDDNFFANHGFQQQQALVTETVQMLKNLNKVLYNRIKERLNPWKELNSTRELIRISVQEVSNVPLLLQSGKDKEAMNTVIRLAEVLQKFNRIHSILQEQKLVITEKESGTALLLKDFHQDLNSILQELNEAFSVKDTVLIGDLLEYEIAPRLERLITFINTLEENKRN